MEENSHKLKFSENFETKELLNESPVINENTKFENTIDLKKIIEIKKKENAILFDNMSQKKVIDTNPIILNPSNGINAGGNIHNENINEYYTQDNNEKRREKLVKHANFYHKFSEYNVNILDVIPLYFKKEKFSQENGIDNNNFIPIITNIKKLNDDQIEITREFLYNDFYNSKPYTKERIIISRSVKNPEDPLFISFYEDDLKKTVTSMSNDSQFSKIVKFKSYRNPNELLFFQNIFHYKMILEMNNYYRMLNKIPEKKHFRKENILYHEYIKNLI